MPSLNQSGGVTVDQPPQHQQATQQQQQHQSTEQPKWFLMSRLHKHHNSVGFVHQATGQSIFRSPDKSLSSVPQSFQPQHQISQHKQFIQNAFGENAKSKQQNSEANFVHPNRSQYNRFKTLDLMKSASFSSRVSQLENSKKLSMQSYSDKQQIPPSFLEDQIGNHNKTSLSRISFNEEDDPFQQGNLRKQPHSKQVNFFSSAQIIDSEDNQDLFSNSPPNHHKRRRSHIVIDASKQQSIAAVDSQTSQRKSMTQSQHQTTQTAPIVENKRDKYFMQRVTVPSNHVSMFNLQEIPTKDMIQPTVTTGASSTQIPSGVTSNAFKSSEDLDKQVPLPKITTKTILEKKSSLQFMLNPNVPSLDSKRSSILHAISPQKTSPSLNHDPKRDSPFQQSYAKSFSFVSPVVKTSQQLGGLNSISRRSHTIVDANQVVTETEEPNNVKEQTKNMLDLKTFMDEGNVVQSAFRKTIENDLNDSLLTSYDVGCLTMNNSKPSKLSMILNPDQVNQSQTQNLLSTLLQRQTKKDNEDHENDQKNLMNSLNNQRRKRDHFYIGAGVYEKIKRVYVRSVDAATSSVEQYFQSKNFKFEWITGESDPQAFFVNEVKKASIDLRKNSKGSFAIDGKSPKPGGIRANSSDANQSQSEESSDSNSSEDEDNKEVQDDSEDESQNRKNLPLNGRRNRKVTMKLKGRTSIFQNKKHYSKDKQDLSRFGVAVCSRKGSLGEDLPNQDNYLFYKDELSSIYAVLDGHGPYGHLIGSAAYRFILVRFLSSLNGFINPAFGLRVLFRSVSQFIETYYAKINSKVNQYISGTSCTFIVNRFNQLTIAHVGDTKAFVYKKNIVSTKKEKVMAVQLTEDHVPSNPSELRRIYNSFGEVRRAQDLSEKIYVRGRNYPGLHLTRSIGDKIAEQVGVVSDPLIKTYEIESNDHFLILGSSGFFDIIPAEEIWSLITPFSHETVFSASKVLQTRLRYLQMQNPQAAADATFVLQFL